MKFRYLIKYDLRKGVLGRWKYYLAIPLIIIVIAFKFENDINISQNYIIYYCMYCFRGIDAFYFSEVDRFELPIVWLSFMTMMLFIHLDYAQLDLSSSGQQLLIRIKSRSNWWISKCVWNIISILLSFLLLLMCVILIGLFFGKSILGDISSETLHEIFRSYPAYFVSMYETVLLVFVMPFFVICTLSQLQMMLTLLLPSAYCFYSCFSSLLLSVFLNSSLLPWSYSMIIRYKIYTNNGLSMSQGILFMVMINTVTFVLGNKRVQSIDILDTTQE